MAYTKYSLTPANNTAAPPDGAPEGMLPSAVNDTMRDMMAQIRDVGDGVRDGTYTMTAPKITGGTITGVTLTGNTLTNPVITGATLTTSAFNGTVGATTASTGAFTTINASTSITNAGLTSGRVTFAGASGLLSDNANFVYDSSERLIVGASSAAIGNRMEVVSNTGSQAIGIRGRVSDGAGVISWHPNASATEYARIQSDSNSALMFGTGSSGTERMRITSAGNVGIGTSSPSAALSVIASPMVNQLLIGASTADSGYGSISFNGTSGATRIGFTGGGSGDPSLYYDAATSGIHQFRVNNAIKMVLDSSGNVLVGITTARANAGDVQVSKGISFPATQSAQSDANTLDDYEEGTFTVTFTPSTSGTITLSGSYNTLSYTKVGRVVTITGEILVASSSAPVGTSVTIGGFPFAAGSGTSSSAGFSVTDLGTLTARVGRISTTNTTADMFITASTIGTNSNFMFGFSYIV